MLAERPVEVFLQPFELLVAEFGEPGGFEPGFEIEDVDQGDKMYPGDVEGVPAFTLRPFAVTIEIELAVVGIGDVVLARYDMDLLFQRLHRLIGVVELLVLRQMGDVTGVDDEGGLRRHRIDFGNRLLERAERVRIGGFVEADMTVADL